MHIKVTIYYQKEGQDWPTMFTQTFLSWQVAMKEGQDLLKKIRRTTKGKVISFLVEDIENKV